MGKWSNAGSPQRGYSQRSISGRSLVIGTSGLSPSSSEEKTNLLFPRKWRNMNLPAAPTFNCCWDILSADTPPISGLAGFGRIQLWMTLREANSSTESLESRLQYKPLRWTPSVGQKIGS